MKISHKVILVNYSSNLRFSLPKNAIFATTLPCLLGKKAQKIFRWYILERVRVKSKQKQKDEYSRAKSPEVCVHFLSKITGVGGIPLN